MLLREFLEVHDLKLIVRLNDRHSWAGQYTVELTPNVDIKDGPMYIGVYGHGKTPRAAIEDYVRKIQGRILELRQNLIEVPEGLALGKSILCVLEWGN